MKEERLTQDRCERAPGAAFRGVGRRVRSVVILAWCCTFGWWTARDAVAQDGTRRNVLTSISLGQRFLRERQLDHGGWPADGAVSRRVGTTCLATLALLKTGAPKDSYPIRQALAFIRKQNPDDIQLTYELALWISLLAVHGDPQDRSTVETLCQRLVQSQTPSGGWTFRTDADSGDLSISHFAAISLRDAARMGVPVPADCWRRIQEHWIAAQNADGGWEELGLDFDGTTLQRGGSTAVGTMAGVATLAMCQQMLATSRGAVGTMTDCEHPATPGPALQHGIDRLSEIVQASRRRNDPWPIAFYHLYGLERGNRQAGRLFAGEDQWRRQGVAALFDRQRRPSGHWDGNNDVIATSYALLLMATEVSPSIFCKAELPESNETADWAWRPHDIFNAAEAYRRTRNLPRVALARETVDLKEWNYAGPDVPDAPVLFLTGDHVLPMSDWAGSRIRDFVRHGGLVFAAPCSDSATFKHEFEELVRQLSPEGQTRLDPLPADHPVFRGPFAIPREQAQLWGAEAGCRLAFLYSPQPIGCHWEQAQEADYHPAAQSATAQALRLGANIAAYAMAGDDSWLTIRAAAEVQPEDDVSPRNRGLLRVGQLRQPGDWEIAPQAMRRLLEQVNAIVGPTAVARPTILTPQSPDLFQHMLLFLHGRQGFSFSEKDLDALRLHLQRGGVLVADACCGSVKFDASFRRMAQQLFPQSRLEKIALEHDLFSGKNGYRIHEVRMRTFRASAPGAPREAAMEKRAPELEGVTVDGRLAIIYSRHDLSCALAGAPAEDCEGYFTEDAERIAVNIMLHALMQDSDLDSE